MGKRSETRALWGFGIAGFGFGLAFPVAATVFECLRLGVGLGYEGILMAHRLNPLLHVIDTAPFFLGVFAAIAGNRQDRLRGYVNSLERRVVERTRQFEEAAERARDADRSKGEFLANTSHEIRTPLNGILGFTDLLSTTHLDSTQREYVAVIERSGKLLLTLINDIIDVSRIEDGRIQIENAPFDVETAVFSAADAVLPRAVAGHLEFIVDVEPEVPASVDGDASRLTQVLVNLLGNAVKFTESGQVILRVTLCRKTPLAPPAGLCFEVTDTGPGIPPDRVDSIFERFTQVDAATTRLFGGSGLGLTITQGLVHLMGGAIEIESEVGRGSTFRVVLPLSESQVGGGTPRRPMEGRTALVCGTGREQILALEHTLERLGFAVTGWVYAGPPPAGTFEDGDPIDLVVGCDEALFDPAFVEHLRRSRQCSQSFLVATKLAMDPASFTLDRGTGLDACVPLPLHPSAIRNAMERGAPAQPRSDNPGVTEFEGRPHALVVDDHPVNRKLAAKLLETLGVRASLAESGLETLEHPALGEVDLIFMDVQMPGIDGLETTRRLRAAGFDRPVIALTARAMESDRKQCSEAGMDGFLTKPFLRADLEHAIESALNGPAQDAA